MARRRSFDEDISDDEDELQYQDQVNTMLRVLETANKNTAAAIANAEKLMKMVDWYKEELKVLQGKYQALVEAKAKE